MNLAAPAPKVEPALASSIGPAEPAVANRVQQSEPPRVEAPSQVEPAVAGYKNTPLKGMQSSIPDKARPLSVIALRGDDGSDFEGYAAVLQGVQAKNFPKSWLPCCFDERDFITYGEAKRYVLVKGTTCFVFGEKNDPSPLYAIPLDELYAIQEDPTNPDPLSITVSPQPNNNASPTNYVTILLKYKTDNAQAYQFTFDTANVDPSLAKQFLNTVQRNQTLKASS